MAGTAPTAKVSNGERVLSVEKIRSEKPDMEVFSGGVPMLECGAWGKSPRAGTGLEPGPKPWSPRPYRTRAACC